MYAPEWALTGIVHDDGAVDERVTETTTSGGVGHGVGGRVATGRAAGADGGAGRDALHVRSQGAFAAGSRRVAEVAGGEGVGTAGERRQRGVDVPADVGVTLVADLDVLRRCPWPGRSHRSGTRPCPRLTLQFSGVGEPRYGLSAYGPSVLPEQASPMTSAPTGLVTVMVWVTEPKLLSGVTDALGADGLVPPA